MQASTNLAAVKIEKTTKKTIALLKRIFAKATFVEPCFEADLQIENTVYLRYEDESNLSDFYCNVLNLKQVGFFWFEEINGVLKECSVFWDRQGNSNKFKFWYTTTPAQFKNTFQYEVMKAKSHHFLTHDDLVF